MSHTPGPFTIEGPSQRQLPNDLGGDYAILSPDGKIIAECFHIVDEETYADALANARLFSKAEDLLAACKAAALKLPMGSFELAYVLDAVAKAEGVEASAYRCAGCAGQSGR